MLSFQNPQSPVIDTRIDEGGQLPVLASTFKEVDDVYYLTTWVIVIFFLLILAVLAYSVARYRRKSPEQMAASNVTHNTMLEVVWTVIPLIIVMVIFAMGWKGSLRMTVPPYEATQNEYKVVAKQWAWLITHPGDTTPAQNEFYVPINTPVSMVMESEDVLHSFFLPNMRIKRDIVPGRYQTVWFEATKLGTFHLFCTEYCGDDHSGMTGVVHVVTQEEYDEQPWNVVPDPETATEEELIAQGKKIYGLCKSCHSVDGSIVVGPSFKNLWGKEEEMTDGVKEIVNLDYLTRSMRDPNSQIVKGDWSGNMAPWDENAIPDAHIQHYLVPFLRSLQDDPALRERGDKNN